MNEIGGYFGLELGKREEYHKDLISLNTARNCLEYILRAKKEYKKIFIPYYTCEVVLEPIIKCRLKYEFYNIDSNLEPVGINRIENNDVFLYTNYFGIKDDFIHLAKRKYKNLIIDNSQSFFSRPLFNIDTFYSPRKFFGVSDGGYLSTNKIFNGRIKQDFSYMRFKHLLTRIDLSGSDGYLDFVNNDKSMINQPIRKMSKITKEILMSIDYKFVKKRRLENFLYLHRHLGIKNTMKFKLTNNSCPLVYPLLIKKDGLRQFLIRNKVYVAQYWPNVLEWTKPSAFEHELTKRLVPLPIDQRYGFEEMAKIVHLVKNYI